MSISGDDLVMLELPAPPNYKEKLGLYYKTFYDVIYGFSQLARVIVPGGKPFQSSLIFVGKARSLP